MESGKMDVGINNRIYPLKRNDLIVINSGDIHYTHCRELTRVYALQVPYPILKTHIPNYDYIRFQTEEGSDLLTDSFYAGDIRSLLMELYHIVSRQQPGYTMNFSSHLYHLLYLLFMHFRTDISMTTKQKSDRNLIRLEQVMTYVKTHYTQPISLEEAAGILSLNQEYFCRYFKKYMGMTFLEYVNSIRLSHIHQDLLNTNYPISELLERHGFTNYKLFSKMFRDTYGCSPRTLRLEHSDSKRNTKPKEENFPLNKKDR